jgi:lipopolysaccharide export LptBFGC system permease protein LptF
MPSFRSHSIAAVAIFILGFFVFSSLTSAGEQWALEDPFRFVLFIPLLPAAAFAIWKWRQGMIHMDKKITFEDQLAPAVEVAMNLDLGR